MSQLAYTLLVLCCLLLTYPPHLRAVSNGDINGDGYIDLFDYNALVSHFGTLYNLFDYNSLVAGFGRPVASPTPQPSSNELLAFPGAEGFGALSRGGRGGTIYHVTNLNDSGTGSLRSCLEAVGPRYCLFDVSGTIRLSTHINVKNPYLTVAGESAPSPGITIREHTITLKTHDVILRHLRFRAGNDNAGGGLDDRDGFKIHDNAYNSIIDHISVSWGVDENLSFWGGGIHDVTVSNSLISEALANAGHTEGIHSMGTLVGDGVKNIALLNNLSAHNADRNFLIKGGGSALLVNNLFYNWRHDRATGVGSLVSRATVLGNVYLKGPDTPANSIAIRVGDPSGLLYAEDNHVEGVGLGTATNTATYPVTPTLVSVNNSSVVEAAVTTHAGARPRDRDPVDTRVVQTLGSRSGRIIDSPVQVGDWPLLPENHRIFPVPVSPHGDDDQDGYTNLEEILHQSAQALDS